MRSSIFVLGPTYNSSESSSHFTSNLSDSTFYQPNEFPAPEENMTTSKIFLLREYLANCFKKLGIKAIASIMKDLILFNSELYGESSTLKNLVHDLCVMP